MTLPLQPASLVVLDSFQGLKGKTPAMAGFFIADSERVVMKLLTSGLPVESVLATADWYARNHEAMAPFATLPLYVADKAQMEKVVGYDLHQGVMARAPRPADVTLADLSQGPLVVLDGVAKAENVGAIVRNAGAFAVTRLLLGPDTCHAYNRRAVRASMGNVFSFQVHQTADLPAALAALKAMGTPVYAFENRPFARSIEEVTFPPRSALLFGSEGRGLSEAALAMADHYVRIPIDERVYALNAACASAVGLYAFARQRT
jgi:tRNA G18 (ribose-2'-O)-methylase SpoU